MIPNWVNKLILDIREVEPKAIIAGGYIRDLITGRTPKDIDIFIPTIYDNYSRRPGLIYDIIRRTHPGMGDQLGSEYFEWDTRVNSVINFQSDDGWPEVQVCAVNGPAGVHDHLDTFDFGICRVAYDGERITITPEFVDDFRHQQITLLRSENEQQFERSMQRYMRIGEKYPGWRLVVPERFAEYKKVYDAGQALLADEALELL